MLYTTDRIEELNRIIEEHEGANAPKRVLDYGMNLLAQYNYDHPAPTTHNPTTFNNEPASSNNDNENDDLKVNNANDNEQETKK